MNTEGTTCRRCKADLSLLVQIDTQRAQSIARAWRCVATGSNIEVIQAATHAHECRADQESWRLMAVAHLLNRDFAAARGCYQAATQK